MTAIDYSLGSRVVNEGTHTVYTKETWADAWTVQPNMSCHECLWTSGPAINTARLRWDVGQVILPGDTTPTTITAWTGRGQFIKVVWLCDDGTSTLVWVGYIDSSSWPSDTFGHQEIIAYGLEKSLNLTPILQSQWWDEQASDVAVSQIAMPFNGPGGLRSPTNHTIGSDDYYLFRDPREMVPNDDTLEPWSTREIVRYLLKFCLPTDNFGVSTLPWTVEGLDLLPDWDRPRIETEFRTVWDVLNELVSPNRLLGVTCGSDGATQVVVKFFTHLAADLTLHSNLLAANPTQHTVVFAPDALTNANFADVGGGYDQVICRGARAKLICTLQTYDDTLIAKQLEAGWTSGEKLLYDTAASGTIGYSALTTEEKRKANATARRDNEVRRVYRAFRLRKDLVSALAEYVDDDCRILPRLPIKSDADWSGTVNPDHFDRDDEGIPIVLTWADPTEDPLDDAKRIDNQAIHELTGVDIKKSFTVVPQAIGRELWLNVHGSDQHQIAKDDFSPLAADQIHGVFDWQHIQATVCLECGFHVEGKYPTTAPTADVVRRLVIDAGPEYQYVEIFTDPTASVDDAVTGVDPITKAAKYSSGGVLADDTDTLNSMAQFIANSVARTRQTVSWTSTRKINAIAVGDLITIAGGATIDAPVTAISIRGGVSVGKPAPATVQAFECYRGQSDPQRILTMMRGGKARR